MITYLKGSLGKVRFYSYMAALAFGLALLVAGAVMGLKGDLQGGLNFVLLGILTWVMHTAEVRDVLGKQYIDALRGMNKSSEEIIETYQKSLANAEERVKNAEERVVILKDIIEAHKVTLARALSAKETHETERN